MSARPDHYRDPDAHPANSLVSGGSALVVDGWGAVLMQRRSDSGNWSIPGGPRIYTDPEHAISYADGEVFPT